MTQNRPDPADAFRKLVTEWERGFDKLANRFMGTDEFSRSMNQMQSMQMSMQKAFNERMANQLSAFNLPSRDDVLRLGENVRAVEDRVARIEEMLITLTGAGSGAKPKGPPRTKLPPSRDTGGDSGGNRDE